LAPPELTTDIAACKCTPSEWRLLAYMSSMAIRQSLTAPHAQPRFSWRSRVSKAAASALQHVTGLLSARPNRGRVGLGRRDRWRRSGGFIDRSPGRRQGTILVPAARHCCPAAGLAGLGTFWIEDATSGSRESRDQRRDRYVTSGATEVWPRRDSEGRLKRAWRHMPHRSTATSVAQASVRARATPVKLSDTTIAERVSGGASYRVSSWRSPSSKLAFSIDKASLQQA
jgi:hypothetical protein